MNMLLGHKVTEQTAEKWAGALDPWLLPGEEVLALFDCNNMRPFTDAIAVTNFRIGGFTTTGWSVDFPYANRIRVEPDLQKETVLVRAEDPAALAYDFKTRRPEMLFKMVHREDHRLLMTTVSAAVASFDARLYGAAAAQMVLSPGNQPSQSQPTAVVGSARSAAAGATGATQYPTVERPQSPTRPPSPVETQDDRGYLIRLR